jgi:hypothetical protein
LTVFYSWLATVTGSKSILPHILELKAVFSYLEDNIRQGPGSSKIALNFYTSSVFDLIEK